MLRVVASQLALDSHEVEDLLQDTFLALAKLSSPPEFPKAWLWRTLRNLALNRKRQWFRRQKREMVKGRPESQPWDPVEEIGQEENLDRLRECLGRLPWQDRELLAAILWGNLSFAEAAQVLGGSPSALHRKFHQIVDRLKHWMGETHHARP